MVHCGGIRIAMFQESRLSIVVTLFAILVCASCSPGDNGATAGTDADPPQPSTESTVVSADGEQASNIIGSWKLVEFQSMDDATGTLAPEPSQIYTMTLNEDGNAAFVLNCNRGRTTYEATSTSGESGSLTFGPVAMTRASCPPPSMDVKIAGDLEYVRSFLLRDGQLYLSLMADGGIYAFAPVTGDAAAAGGTQDISPSFDCSKAESSAEKAVCESRQLAGFDRELSRLYELALATPDLDKERADNLKAYQRGWVKGRNDCWKATIGLENCVAEQYANRIHELRRGYANSRSDDDSGISSGPLAYQCDGLDALVSAVFVRSETPVVSLSWRENWRVLASSPSASGAKYEAGTIDDGVVGFWTKGDEAVMTRSGESDLRCRIEPTG